MQFIIRYTIFFVIVEFLFLHKILIKMLKIEHLLAWKQHIIRLCVSVFDQLELVKNFWENIISEVDF